MKYRGTQGSVSLQTWLRNEWMEYRDSAFLINGRPLHSIHFNQETGLVLRGRYLLLPSLLFMGGAEGFVQKINSSAAGVHVRERLFIQPPAGRFLRSRHQKANWF